MSDSKDPERRKIPSWVWPTAGLVLVGIVAIVFELTRERKDEDRTVSITRPCARDLECTERQFCGGGRCRDILASASECATAQVHFATESASVPEAAEDALVRMARCLKTDLSIKLSIVGTADERGTPEHNQALGERRAMAVARGLTRLGVSGAQIQVVSYGERFRLCAEGDADCWAKNRQASMVPR